MTRNHISYITTISLPFILLISCVSHEQKADAFEHVKNGKENPTIITHDIDDKSKEVLPETYDAWTSFKTQAELKIRANETKIKNIKKSSNVDDKILSKVFDLEEDNNKLRKDIDTYKEEEKLNFETFKTKLNHDANEIDIELKDMAR